MEEEGVKGKALCKRQDASGMEKFTLSLSAQPREHGKQYNRSDSPRAGEVGAPVGLRADMAACSWPT